MKILFLHKWLIMGGVERILINYLHLLKNEKNLELSLLIAYEDINDVFKNDVPDSVELDYIFDKKYSNKSDFLQKNRKRSVLNNLIYKIARLKEKSYCRYYLNKFIRDNKFDLVINFSNHFDPYINFEALNIPIIRWQHLALKDEDSKEVRKEILVLHKYDKIIAICKDMAKQISERAKIPAGKMSVIYNPINFDEIRSKSIIEQKKTEQYFIQVARLDKMKRHIDLIDIYHDLVKRGVKENLYILGDGPERNNLQAHINQLGLQSRCFLLGEIKNPYPYMKNASLFLHTSEREGLPTVLLESLILGVPVVAIDCPTGPREILNNGKCGALVPLGDKERFVDVVMELVYSEKIDILKKGIYSYIIKFESQKIKLDFINLVNNIRN